MPERYEKLDGFRGVTMLSMAAYHTLWDLNYMYGAQMHWYQTMPGVIWERSICISFILLSGFCWPLGHRHLKRGLTVFAAGALVSAVTFLAMPESIVLFGVLTLLGSCMLLLIPMNRALRKIPPLAGILCSLTLFVLLQELQKGYLNVFGLQIPLARQLYRNLFTAWLGFPPDGFYSVDYFPLLTWFPLFLTGYFRCLLLQERKAVGWLREWPGRFFPWLGRHSLIFYLLHQVVIYLILEVIFRGRIYG